MKNILQGIGIVFTLIASFLGLMYILKGDVMISSLISLVIIVIQYFLIEKFIKSKSEITKNKFSVLSIMLWSMFLILAIPISIFLLHALNVEINAKKEIQAVANTKIADLNNMVKAFNTSVDGDHTRLSIELTTQLTIYAQEKDTARRSALAFLLKSKPYFLSATDLDLLDKSNVKPTVDNFIKARLLKFKNIVDSIQTSNKNFVMRYGGVFDAWSRLHINYAFYELDNLLKKNKQTLVNVYKANMDFKGASFDYSYNVEETNMTNPLELFNKHKPFYLFAVIALFYVLILLPYFIEPVSGTYLTPKKGNQDGRKRGGIEIKELH